jgi:hypothetical protein
LIPPKNSSALFDGKKAETPRNPHLKDTEIADWLLPYQKNYKVRLAKLEGKNKTLRLGETISGYAESLPLIGQTFHIFSVNGLLVMRTTEVVSIGSGCIKTKNSIYKVEFIGEEDFNPRPSEKINPSRGQFAWNETTIFQGPDNKKERT